MKTGSNTIGRSLLWLSLLLGFASGSSAQTYVTGELSGTMTLAGSPYIVSGFCQVSGVLTIQPGVIVEMEPTAIVRVYGSIQANGTTAQRITFESTNNTSAWNGVYLDYVNTPLTTNRFLYCDFENAPTAITTDPVVNVLFESLEVMNCTFSNSATVGINLAIASMNQTVKIKNCVFSGSGSGCLLTLKADCSTGGAVTTEFINNVFENLNGTAIGLSSQSGLYSPAQIMNNVFINCTNGVSAQAPWDATVEDCIFVSNTVALAVPGTLPGQLSQDVAFNDFFACATSFSGYPVNFGVVSTTNRNGTPCDFTNNIFVNPQFAGPGDFHLQTASPCIDAGTPDWAWTDMCFPPSQGTSFPDLGIYGGPDACNWLDNVPLLPVALTTSVTNNSLWLNWGALPRSTYQVLYATDLGGSGNWLPFANGQVLATAKPTSFEISPSPSPNGAFFRVQSLGRTPGN